MPHLWRLVVCTLGTIHRTFPVRFSSRSLRKPLRVLEQVNFGADFKVFDKIVEKILVVLGFAILCLKTARQLRRRTRRRRKQKKKQKLTRCGASPSISASRLLSLNVRRPVGFL